MTDQSRRNFLKHASIGAAAVGAAAVLPAAASANAETTLAGPAHDGSFAVWVKDPKSGEISVLVGETEVVHRDAALAKKLAQIAGRGAAS